MWAKLRRKQFLGYVVAMVVITAATAVLKVFGRHVNSTTVSLTFLLLVLFVATAWGSKPAVLASLLGVVCFNYFFLAPVGTFTIADPHNWVSLFAFLITAVIVGQLSAHARRRAEEANAANRETERLYKELQDTFERSSEAKALKQSERLKSALLDAVTHDLRTPLTSIKASVTTLLADQHATRSGQTAATLSDDGRREMLQVIDEEADRLDRFIEGLMGVARIEAGHMHLRKRQTSLNEIIMAAVTRAENQTKSHRLELWLDDHLPQVPVDESAMAEVVYVLIDNAAKYSPPQSVIRVSAATGGDGTVRLAVEDEGPGVPSEMRERVFEKFFRATEPNLLHKSSGMGLGLAIAQGIVEAHSGRIWIEDRDEGLGSRFVVALPTEEERPNGLK